jgi:hypothetical protein
MLENIFTRAVESDDYQSVSRFISGALNHFIRPNDIESIEPESLLGSLTNADTYKFNHRHETGDDVIYYGKLTWYTTNSQFFLELSGQQLMTIGERQNYIGMHTLFTDIITSGSGVMRYSFIGYKIKLKRNRPFVTNAWHAPNPASSS